MRVIGHSKAERVLRPRADTSDGLVTRLWLRAKVHCPTCSAYSTRWYPAVIDTGATITAIPEEVFADGPFKRTPQGPRVAVSLGDGNLCKLEGPAGNRADSQYDHETRRVELVLAEPLKADTFNTLDKREPKAGDWLVTSSQNRGPERLPCWLKPSKLPPIHPHSQRALTQQVPYILLGMDFLCFWKLRIDPSMREFTLTVPQTVSVAKK